MAGDVIARSDQLDERIARSSDIEALVRSSRRNWLLIRILGVSVALDVLLSGGVGYLAYEASRTAQQAASLQVQLHTTCVAGNEPRAGQITLWHYLLDLPPTSPRTPEQQQQAVQFRAYVDRLFAPRRC